MNESAQQPDKSEGWETDFHRWGKRPQPEIRSFFYTRLQARLAQSTTPADWLPWWLRQPAYAYSALLLLVMLNVGAAWWVTHNQTAPEQVTTSTTASSVLDDYEVDSVILAYE